jgi:RNA-directed DNA polymerase
MDIKGFFDNINHDTMVKLLEKRIDDKRFLKLIKAMLKAGYLEDWKFHVTYSGTPQGGIVSPILANVYLHELDEFVDELRQRLNRGRKRRDNPEYRHYSHKIHNLRKEYERLKESANPEDLKVLKKQILEYDSIRKQLPAGDPWDRSYRKVFYCRYADDFVIGIIGSKEDARKVMIEVGDFLQTNLKLQISERK